MLQQSKQAGITATAEGMLRAGGHQHYARRKLVGRGDQFGRGVNARRAISASGAQANGPGMQRPAASTQQGTLGRCAPRLGGVKAAPYPRMAEYTIILDGLRGVGVDLGQPPHRRAASSQSRPNPFGSADWGGVPELEPDIFYAVLV